MAKTSTHPEPGASGICYRLLLFTACGMILSLFLLFLLAILISHGLLPETLRSAAALSAVPGTVLSGFLTGKASGRRILPMGLAAGGLYLLLLFLISAVCPGITNWRELPWVLAAVMGGSTAGALCAAALRTR
ncbi:MAG: TIGR04086 family membrane protein [Ruminococcaceae bacterium]|nr:TIGR04086 family membrane protein [Oscillospiraceae bacterium]